MSFISQQTIKAVAQKLDDMIKLKGIAEMLDGVAIKAVLNIVADKFADKIPQQYQDEVNALLEAFASDDYSKITGMTVDTINGIIDLPFANENDEQLWIAANLQMLGKVILKKAA